MWSASDYEPPVPLPWMKLHSGETLLWVGQPTRSLIVFRARDIVGTIIGLVVVGLGIAGLLSQEREGVIYGALYVAIGFYFGIGRFILNWFLRRNSIYALTTERIMIRQAGVRFKVREKWLARVPEVRKKIDDDGAGTLWFYDKVGESSRLFGKRRPPSDMHLMGLDDFQLRGIPDAAAVVALLENSTEYSHVSDRRSGQDGTPLPPPWQND